VVWPLVSSLALLTLLIALRQCYVRRRGARGRSGQLNREPLLALNAPVY
jgi:hypothetical protein